MAFTKWALSSGYDNTKSIDRIDNDGPYCPENCRWVTNDEQQRNKWTNRHINDGEDILVWADFCYKYNLQPNYIKNRIDAGWSLDAIVYSVKHRELRIHISRGSQKHKYPYQNVYLDKDEFMRLIPKIKDQCKSGT